MVTAICDYCSDNGSGHNCDVMSVCALVPVASFTTCAGATTEDEVSVLQTCV